MKNILLEYGVDLLKISPAGGAAALEALGWLTISNVVYVLIGIYTVLQIYFLIKRVRRAKEKEHLELENVRLENQLLNEKYDAFRRKQRGDNSCN